MSVVKYDCRCATDRSNHSMAWLRRSIAAKTYGEPQCYESRCACPCYIRFFVGIVVVVFVVVRVVAVVVVVVVDDCLLFVFNLFCGFTPWVFRVCNIVFFVILTVHITVLARSMMRSVSGLPLHACLYVSGPPLHGLMCSFNFVFIQLCVYVSSPLLNHHTRKQSS